MAKWTIQRMEAAVAAYRKGQRQPKKVSIREIRRMYDVPDPTLRRYLNGQPIGSKPGPDGALSTAEEEGLVLGLIELHSKGFPATRLRLKSMVLDICRDGRHHQFSKSGPSLKWTKLFLERHRDRLSIRKARILDRARADAFDNTEIECFFAEYRRFLEENQLPATRIYNCDETGIEPQGGTPKDVIAARGAKNVSTKRGRNRENTSVLMTVSAAGAVLPPLFIFRGERLRGDLLKKGLFGSRGIATKNAFIATKVFKDWIDHFIENIPPVRPVLLILDNHSARVALEVLEKFVSNGIEILALPPHTTHLLQPLDAGYFRAFKSEWRDIVQDWSEATWAACVQKHMIAGFVREAIKKSWNSEIMENSWSSTGMWPLDPSKSLTRQAVSNDPAPSSFSTPFVLTNDPLPIAGIKPRDMLRLKRQGIDVSLYRAIGITQRRLNSITPTKPPKDLHYIDLTPKRLLTNAECMAARRLKENELEDQRREKAERKRQIVAKREAKQKEQEAKRIEILVKKRLPAIEEEQKKFEREMKKKQEEDK